MAVVRQEHGSVSMDSSVDSVGGAVQLETSDPASGSS